MKDAFGVERDVVSKIAMRPVYHGTTPAGAAKLKRLISAKDTTNSAFKFSVGKPRADGTRPVQSDTRPEGLYTTTSRESAEHYATTGRSPDRGGLGLHSKKGKVMVFNSVGVKPKYRGPGEEIYDPKELGMPVNIHSTKRSAVGRAKQKAVEENDKNVDASILQARANGSTAPYKTSKETFAANRKKVLGYKPPKPMQGITPPQRTYQSETLPGSL